MCTSRWLLLNFSYLRFGFWCVLPNFRSSISDSGIGMICNVFPETLSRLLLALCPNITSSNYPFEALHLIHCWIYICPSYLFSYCLLFINLLSIIFRWHSVCYSSIASSWTHGLWHDYLWSQFPESNPWWKQWFSIKAHFEHQATPYTPEADYQA